MLKKLISMITILLIASWVGSTWYISKQTKHALNNPQDTIKNIQILSYQQGLTTSKLHFKLAIKTGNETLDPLLQNTLFNADIHHSPISFRKSKLQIGSSHWEVRLDQDTLPNHIQSFIKTTFVSSNPFIAKIDFDFNNYAHYELDISQALITEYEQQIGTLAPSHFFGKINLESLTGNLQGTTGELSIKDHKGHLRIPSILINTAHKGFLSGITTGETHIHADNIHYQSSQLADDIQFDFTINAKQHLINNSLQNEVNLQIENAITPAAMIKNISFNINYHGLVNQDKQATLQKSSSTNFHSLLNLLKENQGTFNLALNVEGNEGKVDLKTNMQYLSSSPESLTPTNIIEAFKTNIQLLADASYIDQTPLALLLATYVDKEIILIKNKEYRLHATINGNKATLNGNKIAVDALTKEIFPNYKSASPIQSNISANNSHTNRYIKTFQSQ